MAKKKKKGHAEAHENAERWLLTYADMITLLMLFFIVLWSMSQVDQKKYDEISAALESVFDGGNFGILNWEKGKSTVGIVAGEDTPQSSQREAQGAGKSAGGSSSLMARATSQLQSLIKNGTVRVDEDERGLRVTIAADVGFDPDSADLDSDGMQVMQQVAQFVIQLDNKLIVEGHTDGSSLVGTKFRSDWEVSSLRAVSVLGALEDYGVQGSRMSTAAYGSTKLLYDNDTPEGRAYNRRVEIVILNEQVP